MMMAPRRCCSALGPCGCVLSLVFCLASSSFFTTIIGELRIIQLAEAAVHPDGACPLLTVLPFSIREKVDDFGAFFSEDYLYRYGFDILASIELAVQHFNDRNDAVVPQLHRRQMGSDCDQVHFPTTPPRIVDSGFSRKSAISGLLRSTYERNQQQQRPTTTPTTTTTTTTTDAYCAAYCPASDANATSSINNATKMMNNNSTDTDLAEEESSAIIESSSNQRQKEENHSSSAAAAGGHPLLPCGVIGPTLRGVFHHVVPTTGALEIPHVSAFRPKNLLWGDAAIGMTPTMAQYAGAILDYVQPREYICVIYTGGVDETELANILETLAPEYGVKMESIREGGLQNIPIVLTPSMREKHAPWAVAARAAHLTGIRTIFILTRKTRVLERYAVAFADLDMLSDDYVYVLHPDAVATDRALTYYADRSDDPEDPVRRLLSGALVFDPALDGFRLSPETDRFLKAWKGLDGDFARRVRDRIPQDSPLIPKYDQVANLGEEYFQTHTPVNYASYAYDAVIALGLGACGEMKESKKKKRQRLEQQQQQQQSNNETTRSNPQGQKSTDADEKSSPPNEDRPPARPSDDDKALVPGDNKPPQPDDGKPEREDGKKPPADDKKPQSSSSDGGKPPPPDGKESSSSDGSKPPKTTDEKLPPRPGDPRPIRPEKLTPHVRGIFETSFEGASGLVRFTETGMLSRELDDVRLGLYNLQYPSPDDGDGDYGGAQPRQNGTTSYNYVPTLVSSWSAATKWEDWQANVVRRRSGTRGLLATTRVTFEENFLPGGVRAIGLTLMGSVWALMTACLAMLYNLRTNQLVKQSQPFFLGLVCLGSLIICTSIFTLSWDEGAGWTTKQLHVACTLTPWFFFVGNIMVFASLSTKMWRIDKVLQFRRHRVNIRSSLGPLLVVLFLTLIILTTWTAEDPWIWERIPISTLPSETYGTCTSRRFWAYFGSLMGVLIVSEAVTIYFTWKTKDIPEGLSDRMPVILALVAQLQAWAIGVPVLALLHPSSTSAVYFGRVGLIWLFSVSAPVAVVCPKLYAAVRSILFPHTAQQRRQSRVSITGINRSGDLSGPASNSMAFGGGFDAASSAFLRHPRPGVDGASSALGGGGGPPSKSFRRRSGGNNAGSFYKQHDKSGTFQRRQSPPSPKHMMQLQRRLSPPPASSGSIIIDFGSECPSTSTASTGDVTDMSLSRKSKRSVQILHPKSSSVVESVVEEVTDGDGGEEQDDDQPPGVTVIAPPEGSDAEPTGDDAADGVKVNDNDAEDKANGNDHVLFKDDDDNRNNGGDDSDCGC